MIAIPLVQFKFGNCQGNDLLCGRKGGQSPVSKDFLRNYNVSQDDGENICTDQMQLCLYHEKAWKRKHCWKK